MKFLTILFIFFNCVCSSQNLVPNPQFTDSTCPIPCEVPDQYCLADWYSPTLGTPDYYDGCWENLLSNWCGISATNNISAPNSGIIVYNKFGTYREYIAVKLTAPLKSNKNYCVEFYAKICKFSIHAIDKFGLYIGDSIFQNNSLELPYIPQIENPNNSFLNDSLVWYQISGNYLANGGEQFIAIGNFRSDLLTNTDSIDTGTDFNSYYLIDNVSIYECDNDSLSIVIPNVFTPNRDEVNDVWELTMYNTDRLEGVIYNRWGEVVHRFIYDSRSVAATDRFYAWDGHTYIAGMPVPDGVYYYQLTATKFNGELENFTGTLTLLR